MATKRQSRDIGDEVAQMLRYKSLDEVYAIAAEVLGVEESALRSKYRNPFSNPGTTRMSLGIKMRNHLKRMRKQE
jgi:hypothetical protein